MIISERFYNVECDCCGALANEELWRCDEAGAKEDALEADYLVLGEKCYCQNCYQYDDDDNIVTKDGRKFNADTREEITEGKK